MPKQVFLDTSYVIALTAATDEFHVKANEFSLSRAHGRAVTTQGVLLEIGNALAKRRFRSAGISLLRYLTSDPIIEVVPIDAALFARGFELFDSRVDKEWGLVDCISFAVMSDRGITEALTSDKHFEQAGFVALLRA